MQTVYHPVEWVEKHFPNKPFTISETGAGGVYEWTNKTDPRWSQQYQLEVRIDTWPPTGL